MIEQARKNAVDAGVNNVEFLLGSMEKIPLLEASVDVVISNCVINLAADKDVVLREAFRVLKPGGVFAVSDIVATSPVPEAVRKSKVMWACCVAGALLESEYVEKLEGVGFIEVKVEEIRKYSESDVSRSMTIVDGRWRKS